MEPDSRCTGVLIVDLDALARNFHRLREAAAPAECSAVVKANAYGLGVAPVATRLFEEGCRRFFVATLPEGLELRGLLPDAHIYVFEGVLEGGRESLLAADLVPVLNTIDQVRRWSGPRRPGVLHLDTGMSRLGLSVAEVEELVRLPELLEGIHLEYLMTHLACADQPEHRLNYEQLERFETLRRSLPQARTSIASSASIFMGPKHCGDLVRAGIGLYGGNPFVNRANPMEPVVTLRAEILQVRRVREASTVGYGATRTVEPPAVLATVGVGYADGYCRSLGNRGVAVIDGARVPVVGRVSMDLLCLDVSGVPVERVRPGKNVDLIGAEPSLDEVAEAAGTISYELLTGLGKRLHRIYEPNRAS